MQQRLSLSCFVILPLSSTMAASAHPPETIGTHDHHAEPQQGAGVHVIDSSREWTSARGAKRWNGSYLASSERQSVTGTLLAESACPVASPVMMPTEPSVRPTLACCLAHGADDASQCTAANGDASLVR